MLVSAKLIKTKQNKAWYSFSSDGKADGCFCVDFDNVNASTIVQSSKSVSDVWALRVISRLIIEKNKNKEIPTTFTYCNGG